MGSTKQLLNGQGDQFSSHRPQTTQVYYPPGYGAFPLLFVSYIHSVYMYLFVFVVVTSILLHYFVNVPVCICFIKFHCVLLYWSIILHV